MNALAYRLDPEQQAALDHAFEGPGLALSGAPGTGKTFTLVLRAERAAALGAALLTAPTDAALATLRASLAERDLPPGLAIRSLPEVAFEILAAAGEPRHRIDDLEGARRFAAVADGLFSLDWLEFTPETDERTEGIDPEITGLRTPERFCAAAYRLVRKLRGAGIAPEAFVQSALRGATQFYSGSARLNDPALIVDTPQKYRDSLVVDARELGRQHAREIDLIKILAKLYAAYLADLANAGVATDVEALVRAAHALAREPRARERAEQIGPVLIDQAEDLTPAAWAFACALRGADRTDRAGLTLAGDPDQATRTFAGACGAGLLAKLPLRIELSHPYRREASLVAAARRALSPGTRGTRSAALDILPRQASKHDEAREVAARVAALLASGVAPSEIAIVTRTLRTAAPFLGALLARDVPVALHGDGNLYELPVVQDALAVLWALADPFRHDWLMRNLEAPWLNLCDATIALLCGEPSDPQPLLFALPEAEADTGRNRWDRNRDLRLGRNVLRGDRDRDLPPEARERLAAFRAALARYEALERRAGPAPLARTMLAETVLAECGANATGRFARAMCAQLTGRIERFTVAHPLASLWDFLRAAESDQHADDDLIELEAGPFDPEPAVSLCSVDGAKGRSFAHVFAVDLRAGAFPRYYVPDAFLYTPHYGVVPKENVGDAKAARTAKITYVLYKIAARENYNKQERRALFTAASRAREHLTLSASGRATRGVSAPEFYEELSR
jgi:superfamily I DNA/RNA helicase